MQRMLHSRINNKGNKMYCDIVFPSENEAEFIRTAGQLGISKVAFAYKFEGRKSVEAAKKRIENLQKNTAVKLHAVFLAKGNDVYKVHDLAEKAIADASENS